MLLHQPSPKGSSIVARMIKNARTYEHIPIISAHRGDSSSGKITGPVRNVRTYWHRGRCPSNSFQVATHDINHIEIFVPATWRGTGLGARYVNTPQFPQETFVPVGTVAGAPPSNPQWLYLEGRCPSNCIPRGMCPCSAKTQRFEGLNSM
jgi:hypothetical protein